MSGKSPDQGQSRSGPLSISSLLTTDEPPSRPSQTPSQQSGVQDSSALFLYKNDDLLYRLHMLLNEENIVLFTPAVAPLYQPGRDPFEPLGRALAKHHSRIRHVPYVHEMTHEHLLRLRESQAAVVVVCDAGGSAKSAVYDNGGTMRSKGSNLEEQIAFAKAVNRIIMDDEGDMFHLPVILVLVTEDVKEKHKGHTIKDNLVQTFSAGTVVQCGNYSKDALERIADRIFDHDVIDRAREREESLGMELD